MHRQAYSANSGNHTIQPLNKYTYSKQFVRIKSVQRTNFFKLDNLILWNVI